MSNMFFTYEKVAKERCDGCCYCRTVYANGCWSFLGCYHEPYHGKWVGEIRDCPIYHEELEDDK